MKETKGKTKGITLIALVVTIVILLILAGISIGILNGDNGIIINAQKAKIEAEIVTEKENIELAIIEVMKSNRYGNITKSELQTVLNTSIGEEKGNVIESDDSIFVLITDSDRYYKLDEQGNIYGPMDVNKAKDVNPGDIKTDENGDELTGTEENPYQINCIEDLCGFSNSVNNNEKYEGKYIVLNRDLDFKSYFSYVNGNIAVDGAIESCKSIEELMENLNKDGFIPIGSSTKFSFKGEFNGKNYTIKNLYEKNNELSGLFGYIHPSNQVEIKNLKLTGKIDATNIVGGLIGKCYCESDEKKIILDNIENSINITSTYGGTGGIIGNATTARAVINRCINYGDITNTNSTDIIKESAGGIVGFIYGGKIEITNCANYGKITGSDNYAYDGTGGIVGGSYGLYSKFYNSINYGEIIGGNRVGGILGCLVSTAKFQMINVINVNNITSKNNWTPGGLIGAHRDITVDLIDLKNCFYVDTNIRGVGSLNAILGQAYSEMNLKSETLVKTLNNYIDSNTDGIDTQTWNKWNFNENDFPSI